MCVLSIMRYRRAHVGKKLHQSCDHPCRNGWIAVDNTLISINVLKAQLCVFLVRNIRAYGGCLDTIQRWRTLQGAISFGEVPSNLWPGDFRMGEPNCGNTQLLYSEYIAVWRRPGEVKHLSSQRNKKKQKVQIYLDFDSLSSGERTGNSPNQYIFVLS